MATHPKKTYTVVTVDDSEDDRFFLRLVLQRFPRFELLHELDDGDEAVAYLTGRGQFAQRAKYPLPDVMLLDLKMQRMSGYDVLRWLRSHSFPSVTVVVLSGSMLPDDIEVSKALGAHGYWSKTSDPAEQQLIALEIEALLDLRFTSLSKT